ncbi:MAG: hypothetical protein QXQ77_00785 [Candidatus Aenigmatarchaeota archaeon]
MTLVVKEKSDNPLPNEIDSILREIESSVYEPLENVMNDKLVAILRNYEGLFTNEKCVEIVIAKTVPSYSYTTILPSLVINDKEYVGVEAFEMLESMNIKPEDYPRLLQHKPVKLRTSPEYYPILQIIDCRCNCGQGIVRFSIPQKGLTGWPIVCYKLDSENRKLIYSNPAKPLEKIRVFEENEFRIVSLESRKNLVLKLLEYAADEWLKECKEFIELMDNYP